MAEANLKKEEDSFTCSVCLDLLKDPVTIPCGHNFCMRCIEGCWDQEDQRGVYSCSLCKHTFTPRPTLYKNTLVAEMVETFRKTRIQAFPITPSDDGPGHVECDVCTGRKLKAVKSCLDCLLSYCETHLKVHNDVNPGRKHSVIDAMGQLQERICSHHKKFLEIFCRTDQSLICYLCKLDEHRGHDTVSAAAERTDKQRQLGQTQEVVRISAAVTNIQIIKSLEYADPELPVRRTSNKENLPPSMSEPVTREEFSQYSCHFTLDPNTAYIMLQLSEGNRRVERSERMQSYPDHPERFDWWGQVLCREGVSGRCYWEVEWSVGDWVHISVSYKSITRSGKGYECRFGLNDKSWSLRLTSNSSIFKHKNEDTKLPLVASSRIGVYVDHRAGTLAFYSISDTMTLLHRVQTTFTHTLYPGFLIGSGSSVRLL